MARKSKMMFAYCRQQLECSLTFVISFNLERTSCYQRRYRTWRGYDIWCVQFHHQLRMSTRCLGRPNQKHSVPFPIMVSMVEITYATFDDLKILPSLKNLNIFVWTIFYLKGLVSSPQLAKCVSVLALVGNTDTTSLRPVQQVKSMDRLQALRFQNFRALKEIIIDKEGSDDSLHSRGYLKENPHSFFQTLQVLKILDCTELESIYRGWLLPPLRILKVI